ncbi:MAG: hypothetical protein EAZ45_16855 [Oscillatoriales cyanobacterium]|nr:MAG: hypothetical protein EAZ45_16855 [Oscillatoriales cyanobacterium]
MRSTKKNSRAKIGWELINQGASTNLLSWEFSSNPDSCIKIFNRSLDDTQNPYFGWSDRASVSPRIEFGAGYYRRLF